MTRSIYLLLEDIRQRALLIAEDDRLRGLSEAELRRVRAHLKELDALVDVLVSGDDEVTAVFDLTGGTLRGDAA